MGKSGVGLAAVSMYGVAKLNGLFELGYAPLEQQETWRQAGVSNERFINGNRERLGRVSIGCSFSPEHLGYLYYIDEQAYHVDEEKSLGALDVVISAMGVKDVRLGVRWSRTVDAAGEFDPQRFDREYKPYLDYCIKKGANVCLNVGPIKTFRYPEEHVPLAVLARLDQAPAKGGLILADAEIAAGQALPYLDSLLAYVASLYSRSQLARITIVQPENEPFNSAGVFSWVMSEHYLTNVVDVIRKYFPHSSILLNSAGAQDLRKITDLFTQLVRRDPAFRDNLLSGIDYYYKNPAYKEPPVLGKLFDWVDPITLTRLKGRDAFEEHRRDAHRVGFKVEVTEAQAEPWGSLISPGNSAQGFRFVLLRCMDHILDPAAESVVRVWGVELLVKRMFEGSLTREHKEIIELITTINSLS